MARVALSAAQVSALECRDGGGLDSLVLAAWTGDALEFEEADREGLWEELNDASNSEDAFWEMYGDKRAGRAARSLAAVAGKVLKSNGGKRR